MSKVCLHQELCGIEILIESLFRDGTASSVRTVNGVHKYVIETSETISLENIEHSVTRKAVAKAKPRPIRPMPTMTLRPISVLFRERKWINIQRDSVKIVLQCQKPWSDSCDMIHQFFDKMMEQYALTILWKNQDKVRWNFAMAN